MVVCRWPQDRRYDELIWATPGGGRGLAPRHGARSGRSAALLSVDATFALAWRARMCLQQETCSMSIIRGRRRASLPSDKALRLPTISVALSQAEPLVPFRPQTKFLSLISTGEPQRGCLTRNGPPKAPRCGTSKTGSTGAGCGSTSYCPQQTQAIRRLYQKPRMMCARIERPRAAQFGDPDSRLAGLGASERRRGGGIAGVPDRADDGVCALRGAGRPAVPRGLRVGEQVALPVRQCRRQRDVGAVARPVAMRRAGDEALLRKPRRVASSSGTCAGADRRASASSRAPAPAHGPSRPKPVTSVIGVHVRVLRRARRRSG